MVDPNQSMLLCYKSPCGFTAQKKQWFWKTKALGNMSHGKRSLSLQSVHCMKPLVLRSSLNEPFNREKKHENLGISAVIVKQLGYYEARPGSMNRHWGGPAHSQNQPWTGSYLFNLGFCFYLRVANSLIFLSQFVDHKPSPNSHCPVIHHGIAPKRVTDRHWYTCQRQEARNISKKRRGQEMNGGEHEAAPFTSIGNISTEVNSNTEVNLHTRSLQDWMFTSTFWLKWSCMVLSECHRPFSCSWHKCLKFEWKKCTQHYYFLFVF